MELRDQRRSDRSALYGRNRTVPKHRRQESQPTRRGCVCRRCRELHKSEERRNFAPARRRQRARGRPSRQRVFSSGRLGDLSQRLIERSGPVTINVESDETKAYFFELSAQAIKRFDVQSRGQFFSSYFDPRDFAVVTDAALLKTKEPHDFLTLINHSKLLGRNGRSIRNT